MASMSSSMSLRADAECALTIRMMRRSFQHDAAQFDWLCPVKPATRSAICSELCPTKRIVDSRRAPLPPAGAEMILLTSSDSRNDSAWITCRHGNTPIIDYGIRHFPDAHDQNNVSATKQLLQEDKFTVSVRSSFDSSNTIVSCGSQ